MGAGTPRQISAKYVGRARGMLRTVRDPAEIYDDGAGLVAMNCKKRGRPCTYTHSLVAAISGIRGSLNLDFGSREGVLPEGKGPECATIFRISTQDASIRKSLSDFECGEVALSLAPATRSEHVRVVHGRGAASPGSP